jgi:predicted ATPase
VIRSGDELALPSTKERVPGAGDLAEFIEGAVFLRLSPTALATPVSRRGRLRGPILAEDGSDLALLIEKLPAASRKRVIQRMKAIFPSVEDIGIREAGADRYFVVDERMKSRGGTRPYPIPAGLLSEGTRRIAAIYALLEARPRPPLIAIEELENGLDPWTLQVVLDDLRQAADDGTQVIVTTHSPFLLDHFEPEQIIHVERTAGESTFTRASDVTKVAEYRGVLAPGAMYLSRVFGLERKATDAEPTEG